MSEFRSARTVLAGAAIVVLAGCTASGGGGTPQISTGVGTSGRTSAGAASSASSATQGSATQGNGATSKATSNSFVGAGSIPFPVAVGNTWLYQVTAGNGERGIATNKIVSAVPTAGGYRVTMSQTIGIGATTTTTQPVYIFYSNGTIGYPVTQANGVSVVGGNGVLWPDAAGIASGQAYQSVLRILVSQSGSSRYENANVTVQGEGTASVTVPAGTYQATVVVMTIGTRVGSFLSTVEVKTWLAPGTGPVKSEVLVLAEGKTTPATTEELLSFTKGAARADGS